MTSIRTSDCVLRYSLHLRRSLKTHHHSSLFPAWDYECSSLHIVLFCPAFLKPASEMSYPVSSKRWSCDCSRGDHEQGRTRVRAVHDVRAHLRKSPDITNDDKRHLPHRARRPTIASLGRDTHVRWPPCILADASCAGRDVRLLKSSSVLLSLEP